MSNTYKGTGERIEITAPTGGYASGAVAVVRAGLTGFIAICVAAIAASATGEAEVTGVHLLPKTAGTAFAIAQGALVYWDTSVQEITNVPSANVTAGYAYVAAGASDTTIQVKLDDSTK